VLWNNWLSLTTIDSVTRLFKLQMLPICTCSVFPSLWLSIEKILVNFGPLTKKL